MYRGQCNLNVANTPTLTKGTKKPQGKATDAISLSNALASIMEGRDDDEDSNQGEDETSVSG